MANQYNPDKHHRQSIRLRGWDYTTPGAYFITICTCRRENLFEEDTFRDLAENTWQNIPAQPHAQHVILDEWVVMPNHLHGVLVFNEIDNVGVRHLGKKIVFQNHPSIRDASPLQPANEFCLTPTTPIMKRNRIYALQS